MLRSAEQNTHMVPRKESQPRSSTACKELGILQRPHKSTQRFILSILNPVCDREPIFCISVFPLVCQVDISLRFERLKNYSRNIRKEESSALIRLLPQWVKGF